MLSLTPDSQPLTHSAELLIKVCHREVPKRYDPITTEVLKRLTYELDIIIERGYSDYFLIVWDIVRWARKRGIPVVGRGSAAGSLVSYLLGITPVDPIKHHLVFERFLNPERQEPPDIDIDLCWKRRDEVIDYVYERYGRDRVAMISTYNTYKLRGAVRDVARAMGVPETEINTLARRLPLTFEEGGNTLQGGRDTGKLGDCRGRPSTSSGLPRNDKKENQPPVQRGPCDSQASLDTIAEDDGRYTEIFAMARRLLNRPRHMGIHAGGIVIAPDRITKYVPLQPSAKGPVVTQFDMHGVEKMGLVKIDLLGQRSLTVVAEMARTLKEKYGIRFDPHHMPQMDEKTRKLIRSGETMGVFQIESPGMRGLLKKLKVDSFDMITAASSVIRPGPSDSGMRRHFILRHHGKEKVETPHPAMMEILKETYGVMLYQEDVIKIAEAISGWSLGKSDKLRRSMSGKRVEEPFMEHRDRFIRDAVKRGINVDAAVEIWRQMEAFSGYAFCKAHSASYSVISVQCAWLKAHFPAEFLAAVMSNYGGFYHTSCYLEEARRMGIKILPPDVNLSEPHFTARDVAVGQTSQFVLDNQDGCATGGKGAGQPGWFSYVRTRNMAPSPPWIRVGLLQVKYLTRATLTRILEKRRERPFESLEDFCLRVNPSYREAESLIRCGGFDSFDYTRPQHLWRFRLMFDRIRDSGRDGDGHEELFPQAVKVQAVFSGRSPGWTVSGRRRLPDTVPEVDYPLEKKLRDELELMELTVEKHPLWITREALRNYAEKVGPFVHARDLDAHRGKRVRMVGWMITTRRARAKGGRLMQFLSCEDLTGTFECVLFPAVYRRYGRFIRGRGPYIITGRVEDDFGHTPVTVKKLTLLKRQ
ncbi:MAG: DNA polymerase III subunit alpha [Fidelibacterota bacterium]